MHVSHPLDLNIMAIFSPDINQYASRESNPAIEPLGQSLSYTDGAEK
jgi:hypothetical protein